MQGSEPTRCRYHIRVSSLVGGRGKGRCRREKHTRTASARYSGRFSDNARIVTSPDLEFFARKKSSVLTQPRSSVRPFCASIPRPRSAFSASNNLQRPNIAISDLYTRGNHGLGFFKAHFPTFRLTSRLVGTGSTQMRFGLQRRSCGSQLLLRSSKARGDTTRNLKSLNRLSTLLDSRMTKASPIPATWIRFNFPRGHETPRGSLSESAESVLRKSTQISKMGKMKPITHSALPPLDLAQKLHQQQSFPFSALHALHAQARQFF